MIAVRKAKQVNISQSFPRIIDPLDQRNKLRASLRPGVRIDNYTLRNPLGRGAFGEVWEATVPRQSGIFAIKIGEKESRVERTMRKLTRKAKVLQIRDPDNNDQVRDIQRPHPNVVGHHEVGSYKAKGIPKYAYKVMEKIEGKTLLDLMLSPDWGDNKLKVFVIMRKILLGLEFLHSQKIVHNDIKESNILVTDDWDVVIFDFGGADKFPSGSLMGTSTHFPPERSMYSIAYTFSDIYSLGVVFYQMLTLKHPYDPADANGPKIFSKADTKVFKENMKYGNLDPTVNSLHPLIQRLLKGMLAINPQERFKSCKEVIDLIDDIIIELF